MSISQQMDQKDFGEFFMLLFCFVFTMEYYLTIKDNHETFIAKWIDLETIPLSEMNWTHVNIALLLHCEKLKV